MMMLVCMLALAAYAEHGPAEAPVPPPGTTEQKPAPHVEQAEVHAPVALPEPPMSLNFAPERR